MVSTDTIVWRVRTTNLFGRTTGFAYGNNTYLYVGSSGVKTSPTISVGAGGAGSKGGGGGGGGYEETTDTAGTGGNGGDGYVRISWY